MEREVFQRMADIEDRHWWFVSRRKLISLIIDKNVNLPQEANILEAGCGTGGNIEFLKNYGSVCAFECDEIAREIAKEKSGLDIEYGDLPYSIPYNNKKFDIVFFLDVLEHIDEHTEALRELRSLLTENGRVFITVPAYQWLWSKHDEDHHHFRRYSKKDLFELVEDSGYYIETLFRFNMFLLPVVILQRFLKKLFRLDKPDDEMPSKFVNHLLGKVFLIERFFIGSGYCLPFGLTIGAVIKKK